MPFQFTYRDYMREIQREVSYRRTAYPRLVSDTKMDLATATQRLRILEELALRLGRIAEIDENLPPMSVTEEEAVDYALDVARDVDRDILAEEQEHDLAKRRALWGLDH